MKIFNEDFMNIVKGKLQKVKGMGMKGKLVVLLVVGIIIGYIGYSVYMDTPINTVKNGHFYQIPHMTIGELFDKAFHGEGEWTEMGEDVVVYRVNRNGVNLVVKFSINGEELNISQLWIDGENQMLGIGYFMEGLVDISNGELPLEEY